MQDPSLTAHPLTPEQVEQHELRVRHQIQSVLSDVAEEYAQSCEENVKSDAPNKLLSLLCRLAETCLPKISRVEHIHTRPELPVPGMQQ